MDIQHIRKDMLKKAIQCADSKLPYHAAGITRDALWQQWGLDARKRFSEYRIKLFSPKKTNIHFKKLELLLALLLSLFLGNTEEEACDAMYAFGHAFIYIPQKFRTSADDILYASYRVIRFVNVNYSSPDADNEIERAKKRVNRLQVALEYISDKENGEQDLYAYFFEKTKNNHTYNL